MSLLHQSHVSLLTPEQMSEKVGSSRWSSSSNRVRVLVSQHPGPNRVSSSSKRGRLEGL